MNPNPLASLNHFTVPVAIDCTPRCDLPHRIPSDANHAAARSFPRSVEMHASEQFVETGVRSQTVIGGLELDGKKGGTSLVAGLVEQGEGLVLLAKFTPDSGKMRGCHVLGA